MAAATMSRVRVAASTKKRITQLLAPHGHSTFIGQHNKLSMRLALHLLALWRLAAAAAAIVLILLAAELHDGELD